MAKKKPAGSAAPQRKPIAPKAGFKFPSGKFVDPSYLSELQAQQRGLKDLFADTRRDRRRLGQDTRIRVGAIQQQQARGTEDIGSERADLLQTAQRGREDFGTRLTNLISDFQQLGKQQYQTGLAAGLGPGGSFGAASGAARAANLARQRQPIDTGLARLEQDTQTGLGKLNQAQQRLGEDTGREMMLAGLENRRGAKDIRVERRRGRREYILARPEIAAQARFQAQMTKRSLNPYGAKK